MFKKKIPAFTGTRGNPFVEVESGFEPLYELLQSSA